MAVIPKIHFAYKDALSICGADLRQKTPIKVTGYYADVSCGSCMRLIEVFKSDFDLILENRKREARKAALQGK